MTDHYVVEIELDRRMPKDDELDELLTELSDFHVSAGESASRSLSLTITLPAEGLRHAVATGLALVMGYGDPVVVTALPERVRDERQGWEPVPEMLSVTQAAEKLGTTRQAVLQRIASGSLPASKVGRDYAIPAAAVKPPST